MDLAQVSGVHELLELEDGGMVLEDVAHHEDPFAAAGRLHELLRLPDLQGEGLLHEHVLARLERLPRQLVMEDGGAGHRDRLYLGIVQQVVEAGDGADTPVARLRLPAGPGIGVAHGGQMAHLKQVAAQVPPPVSTARQPNPDPARRHLFQSLVVLHVHPHGEEQHLHAHDEAEGVEDHGVG